MATNIEIKAAIDTDITNKTLPSSVTNTNVGERMKSVVDYVVQETTTINNNISAIEDNISTIQSDINNLIPTYKKLCGKLTQSGTNNPTLTIFYNTFIGSTPTVIRFNTGAYGIYLPGTLDFNKLTCFIGDDANSVLTTRTSIYKASDGINFIVGIGTYDITNNTVSDNRLNNTPFEIIIYN